jgi:hypothetical protein
MAYNEKQFTIAYTALTHMWHGLRNVDIDEVMRHIRIHTSHQHDPVELANIEKLMFILEATNSLREVMKANGVPQVPPPARPQQASQPVHGQTGNA